MERFERVSAPLFNSCESKTLNEFGDRLLMPKVDQGLRAQLDQLLVDFQAENGQLRASFNDIEKRIDDGDLAYGKNSEDKKTISQRRIEALDFMKSREVELLSSAMEACVTRGMIDHSDVDRCRFRRIADMSPNGRMDERGRVSCFPDEGEGGSAVPLTIEQLHASVLYSKAFKTGETLLNESLVRAGIKSVEALERVYIDAPDEHFFARAIVTRQDPFFQQPNELAGDFTPPPLTRSVLYGTAVYRATCEVLAQAIRYGLIDEVLPGGLDQWAASAVARDSSRPTAAFKDLMMAEAFDFCVKRNIVFSTAALETYFASRTSTIPSGDEILMVSRMADMLGLRDDETDVFYTPFQGLNKSWPSPHADNPFAPLVRIWESGLAPVRLTNERLGVAFTPFSDYLRPKDISESVIRMEEIFEIERQDRALGRIDRDFDAPVQDAPAAPEDEAFLERIRQVIAGIGNQDPDEDEV